MILALLLIHYLKQFYALKDYHSPEIKVCYACFFAEDEGASSQRHSILVGTRSSSSAEEDGDEKKLVSNEKNKLKSKPRSENLRKSKLSRSTSQIQLVGNVGIGRRKESILAKGIRKVQSSSNCTSAIPLVDGETMVSNLYFYSLGNV